MAKRKLPRKFYKDLEALRETFGDTEYDRDEMIPGIKRLLSDYAQTQDEILTERAVSILDRVEKSEGAGGPALFDLKDHVLLGERLRIKRSRMSAEHVVRRVSLIDNNMHSQSAAWTSERSYWQGMLRLLEGKPPNTKIGDVVDSPPAEQMAAE